MIFTSVLQEPIYLVVLTKQVKADVWIQIRYTKELDIYPYASGRIKRYYIPVWPAASSCTHLLSEYGLEACQMEKNVPHSDSSLLPGKQIHTLTPFISMLI